MHSLQGIAVLIPARNPGAPLSALLLGLVDADFGAVLLVNDGSSLESERLFSTARDLDKVHVLHHAMNLGKGRALKTGINYFLTDLPQFSGLVTADADGQHTLEDILRVADRFATSNRHVVLGARQFGSQIPLRSRFGNELTRHLFGFVTGMRLADTQTGLRAFPRSALPALLLLDGERYEYEMTVLAHLCRTGARPTEVPITAVYIDGNRSSHFQPVRDSMRIYFVLARFFASSLFAAGIDFAGFTLAFALTHNLLTSVLVGRVSSLANFALNRRYVFRSRVSLSKALLRYYLLVLAVAAVSYGTIRGLTGYLGWNVFVTKLVADTLISLASFSVQRTFVFPVRHEE
jgi:glycosyltransferase involved in cell wall biosynthesis